METRSIFLAGSSDLRSEFDSLGARIGDWRTRHGVADLAVRHWLEATVGGLVLSDRLPVQRQLRNLHATGVLFTVCLFSEKCGDPQTDDIDAEARERFAPHLSDGTRAGILHPWPTTRDGQQKALAAGQFPLTGTVFELFWAHAEPVDNDNLILGVVSSGEIGSGTDPGTVVFGNRREEHRIAPTSLSDTERKRLLDEDHAPQIGALLNLLRYLRSIGVTVHAYPTHEVMIEKIMQRLDVKLRRKLGFDSARNPFKRWLGHWTMEDPDDPPGRDDLLGVIRDRIKGRVNGARDLHLIRGPSGCGKSSLLQGGVLRYLKSRGCRVLALRPTDFGTDAEVFPQFLRRLCAAVEPEWQIEPAPRDRTGQAQDLASRIAGRLGDKTLVIGLDQFEEILDDLRDTSADRDLPGGWWQVLDLVRHLMATGRAVFVATLETKRVETFKSLGIAAHLDAREVRHEAEVHPEDLMRIATAGFARARITLTEDFLTDFTDKVRKFQTEQGNESSVLPLVGLWLHWLFERFEDEATEESTSAAMNAASSGAEITLERLKGLSPDGVDFGDLIARMARDAWSEAGASDPADERDEFESEMDHFLFPLVGLDADGRVRLLAAPGAGAYTTHSRLLAAFLGARLLVPAGSDGGSGLVRLAHQAVLDHWEPAREWLARWTDLLEIEERFRTEARRWARRGGEPAFSGESAIAEAAQILSAYRANWPCRPEAGLDPEDAVLRRFCLAVFETSATPRAPVPGSRSGISHVSLAAFYHLIGLLTRFLDADPCCARMTGSRGDTLLHDACWNDGPAVEMLLAEEGLAKAANTPGWHPIAAAISGRARRNIRRMLGEYRDRAEPVGPDGMTLAHVAAQADDLETLRHATVDGAVPEAQTEKGRMTPLHLAAGNGSVACFRALLRMVSPAIRDAGDNTAIHEAAWHGGTDILRAFLDRARSAEIAAVLAQRGHQGRTPLMTAAIMKRADIVELLIAEGGCDPADAVHRHPETQKTLFHYAVSKIDGKAPGDAEKRRARETVAVLLRDGRLDPSLPDRDGETPYDYARGWDGVRDLLVKDSRIPSNYADMSAAQRLATLLSRKPGRAVAFVRAAPQSLTDLSEEKTGLSHLIDKARVATLEAILAEGLVPEAARAAHLAALGALALRSGSRALQDAALAWAKAAPRPAAAMSSLLVLAVRARKSDLAETCLANGASGAHAPDGLGRTSLHLAALLGEVAIFATLAAAAGQAALPRDCNGQPPSAVAPEALRPEFEALEARHFSRRKGRIRPRPAIPSVLHALAAAGDLRRFESIARRADYPLPLDKKGRPPSAAAPDGVRAEFERLEKSRFAKGALTMSAGLHVIERETPAEMAAAEVSDLSDRLGRDHPDLAPVAGSTGRRYPLSFHEAVTLVAFTDPSWRPAGVRRCFLDCDGKLFPLEGTSPPIHEVNAISPPILTEATTLDYLAFFCAFIHGDDGPFLVVDRADCGLLPQDADRSAVTAAFRKPALHGRDPAGNWWATALVCYSNALFFADFVIQPDGMVRMEDDEAVATGLPFTAAFPLKPSDGAVH